MDKKSMVPKKDLLLEIGCEELPSRYIPGALAQLEEAAASLFREHRLAFESCQAWATPRRLALLVRGLEARQPDLQKKVKGPALERAYDAAGSPTPALLGFARSQGLAPEELIVETVNGNKFIFALKEIPGQATADLLPRILTELLRRLSFPRPMYWESKECRFARPIRNLLALYGEKAIPFSYAGVTAGRSTFGHRFLSSGPVVVKSPAAYLRSLEENYVLADHERRREAIRQQLMEQAAALGGRPLIEEALLEEVTFLVEYPVAVTGSFSTAFLDLPREVLITTMQVHQRYFPVVKATDGSLLPHFIGISNNRYHENIRRGYEKVLGARLADARFFFEEDRKEPLERHAARLSEVLFQEELGSLAQKQERLVRLVRKLASTRLPGGAGRAPAALCRPTWSRTWCASSQAGGHGALCPAERGRARTARAIYGTTCRASPGTRPLAPLKGLSFPGRPRRYAEQLLRRGAAAPGSETYALRRRGQGLFPSCWSMNDLSPAELFEAALREYAGALSSPPGGWRSCAAPCEFITSIRFALQEKDSATMSLSVPGRPLPLSGGLSRRALEEQLRSGCWGCQHRLRARQTWLAAAAVPVGKTAGEPTSGSFTGASGS